MRFLAAFELHMWCTRLREITSAIDRAFELRSIPARYI